MEDPSQPNDEGITALHNAVCAGHTEIVKFLVQFGVNVNAADSDGWYVKFPKYLEDVRNIKKKMLLVPLSNYSTTVS